MSEQKTLLDEIAISAMNAFITGHCAHYGHRDFWPYEDIASEAYDMAEEMLAEKKKREKRSD